MAIVRTGLFSEGGSVYIYGYSDAPATLTVNSGSIFSMAGATGPFLGVGVAGAGNDGVSRGEVSITGAGSRIDLISAGSPTTGASFAIGRDGGRGALRVTQGAEFRLVDPIGAAGSDSTGGGEGGWVGRGAGSHGTVEVRAAQMRVSGTGSNLSVGRDGGTGNLVVAENASFVMQTTSSGAGDFTHLRLGSAGGTGSASISNSFALVQAGVNAGAAVDVGRDAGSTGSLTIIGRNAAPFRDGLFVVGNAASPDVQLRIGQAGGEGTATVAGGGLMLVNAGGEILRGGGVAPWPGPPNATGTAQIFVGRDAGSSGSVTVTAAGSLAALAGGEVQLNVGVLAAQGVLDVNGAELGLRSFTQRAMFTVGGWIDAQGPGAEGVLTLRNAARASIEGRMGVVGTVGRDHADTRGTLSIESGSQLLLHSETGAATSLRVGHAQAAGTLTVTGTNSRLLMGGELAIGQTGGTGTAQVSGGGLIRNERDDFASLHLGRGAGSVGTLSVTGGTVSVASRAQDLRFEMGVDGGTGSLGASATSVIRATAEGFASFRIGTFGGTGTMTMSTSTLEIASAEAAAQLEVGLGSGSRGNLTLTNSQATLSATGAGLPDAAPDAYLLVGTEGGTGEVLLDNSRLTITGAQSAGIRVGTRWTDTPDTSGSGALTLRNGAEVSIASGIESADFWIGGGQGSAGQASIQSGARLHMGGNGIVGVGLVSAAMTPGGMTGTLGLDGLGSHMTGVRGLVVGAAGSSGTMTVTNGATAFIGGAGTTRNVFADFGSDTGSGAALSVTNAIMAVQAGLSSAETGARGAALNLGLDGGTAQVVVTGQRATNPDPNLRQGLAVLGNHGSDYATLTIGGWDAASRGTVTVTGAGIAALNAGSVFAPDGQITQLDWGGYAAIRVGRDSGTGALVVQDRGLLRIESGGAESAELHVGTRNGAQGSFVLRNGSEGHVTGYRHDAWMFVGAEGGASGSAVIDASVLEINGLRNAGLRVGVMWFDHPDMAGIGALTVTNGGALHLASGASTNFYIGGGLGSQASATIEDGARVVMSGNGHRLALIGGSPAAIAGTGGTGSLTIEGAQSALSGMRDLLVGTNGGTGRLALSDGGRLAFADQGGGRPGEVLLGVGIGRVHPTEPATTATGAFLAEGAGSGATLSAAALARAIVGASGGTGRLALSAGSDLVLNAAVSTLEIGIDGGFGRVDVAGASLTVAGGDGRVHLGRLRDPAAATGGDGAGVLRIGPSGTVNVATKLELGDATGHAASLVLAGGTLNAPLVELHAGPTLTSSVLMGQGQIIGTAGLPAVLISGASLFVGDDILADGARVTGTGALRVTGHVVARTSALHFDAATSHDQLIVTGGFSMDGGSLTLALGSGAQGLIDAGGMRLITATGGVALNNVALDLGALPGGGRLATELRAGGTELWAVAQAGSGGGPAALPASWRDWFDWIGRMGGETGGGGANPPPPAPGAARPASAIADPHLVTFDGLGYSFHAAGEFVLVRPISGTGFEVQARMAPVAANASENVALAVRLAGGSVMVSAATPDQVLVNGLARTIAEGQTLAVGTDLVYRTGTTYHLVHRHGTPQGSAISAVSAVITEGRLDITTVLDTSLAGRVEGLLGNFDGNQANDLALPDGRLVARPLTFGDDPVTGALGLYGAYRDAWRVDTPAESLFTYAAGQGPGSFYLPDYPGRMLTLDDFSPARQAAATSILTQAGLAPGTLAFGNALFDLLATGNESYVAAARFLQQKLDARPVTAPPVTMPDVAGGSLDGLIALTGRVLTVSDGGFAGLRVTFTTTGQSSSHIRTTGSTGDFEFQLLPNPAGGRIEIARSHDPRTDASPTAFDALEVLRMAAGLRPAFGPATPEAFIAADFDRNGQVLASDALEILRVAAGLPTSSAPRWVFVNAADDLSGITASSVSYQQGLALPTLPEAIGGIEMKAILLGHMSAFA